MPELSCNPYTVLQISEEASYEQIKQRYRHLSKLIHPDKQPIQNYQMAQKHFKQIDQAYKAISSRLRRYIYKKYGPMGINVMQGTPYDFQDYENANFDDLETINNIDQLMMYYLREQHAAFELDKGQLRTRSVFLIWKPVNKINKLPRAEKTIFEFETSMPDALGFYNTLKISHSSQRLTADMKSNLTFGVGSSRRIYENVLLNINTQINNEQVYYDMAIDGVFNPNFIMHFVPITINDGNLGIPQVGIDAQSEHYSLTAITDLHSLNMSVSLNPNNKKSVKMIKFSFEQNAVSITPTYQRELTSRLKIVFQLQATSESISSNEIKLMGRFIYGYKLKITDEIKLELCSAIGFPQNYLQIAINMPKYRMDIPIFCKSDALKFECYKIGTIILIYCLYQFYNYCKSINTQHRKRMQYTNYNRLSVEKNTVSKAISENESTAEQSLSQQLQFKGLIICLAYIGAHRKINSIHRTIKKDLRNYQHSDFNHNAQMIINNIQQKIQTNANNFDEQVYEITRIVQSRVKGGQLLGYDVNQLGINPCLCEQSHFYSLVLYWSKCQFTILIRKNNQSITINRVQKHYRSSLFTKLKNAILDYIIR